jgi:hypothetical protein
MAKKPTTIAMTAATPPFATKEPAADEGVEDSAAAEPVAEEAADDPAAKGLAAGDPAAVGVDPAAGVE